MEAESHDPGDALDQLRDIGEKVNDDWRFVIFCLQKATYELIDVDEETYAALEVDFWSNHTALLKREEERQPGISHQIFMRFEEIAVQYRQAEQEHFERELKRQKRRAFFRGIVGLDTDPITYEEIMASRRQGDGFADL